MFSGEKSNADFVILAQDTAKDHGCFNLRCVGFVQTSNEILLGGAFTDVSKYNGGQYSYGFYSFKVPHSTLNILDEITLRKLGLIQMFMRLEFSEGPYI